MFFKSPLLTSITKTAHTSHIGAWKDSYYETYRLNFELPAVRLHSHYRGCGGKWFAVDTYNMSLRDFHNSMALLTAHARPQPWFFKRPDLDWYILAPATVLNVGIAAEQGFHDGGGLQFEYVRGHHAQLLEHAKNPKRVTL